MALEDAPEETKAQTPGDYLSNSAMTDSLERSATDRR